MEDLEGLTGLKRTKGGSKDTEPAYVIRRVSCCRWVACIFLAIFALGVWVWRSEAVLRKLSPRLAARRAAMRHEQHAGHARATKLGQELEMHLQQDAREKEVALKLRAKLRVLEKTHRANVTRALDAAAIGDADFTPAARDAAQPYVDEAIEALFSELKDVLEQRVLQPMMASSNAAKTRHAELHEEVLSELRKEREEREAFLKKKKNLPGDRDGDGFREDQNLDGVPDTFIDERDYDEHAAERRDEEWRRDVLANFVESFERHFNDTAMEEEGLEPRALLTEKDRLYEILVDLRARLGFPTNDYPSSNETAATATWRDAERELEKLKSKLQGLRCHEFIPWREEEDDQFDYMQVHNVERYLSDMIWHAKLNSYQLSIEKLIREYDAGRVEPMAMLEKLEKLEGDNVFPSFWLYHSMGPYDDFRYGDW